MPPTIPLLFGSGSGFGGAFAYAKQTAAFAARAVHPQELSPSISLANPPRCGGTPDTPHSVAQKRINIHPMRHAAFRQGFKGP